MSVTRWKYARDPAPWESMTAALSPNRSSGIPMKWHRHPSHITRIWAASIQISLKPVCVHIGGSARVLS